MVAGRPSRRGVDGLPPGAPAGETARGGGGGRCRPECSFTSLPPARSPAALQLLHHASDDTLRSLHRKLAAVTSSRSRALARAQSVPGRIMLEAAASGGASPSSAAHSSSSSPGSSPAGSPWLHRASGDGGGAPRSSLRRTSSIGLPPLSGGGTSAARPAGASQHRLSGSALRRTSSLEASPAGSRHATPEKQAAPGSGASSGACTPEGLRLLPLGLPYEDSAGGLHVGAGKAARCASSGSGADSPLSPVELQHPLLSSQSSDGVAGAGSGSTAASSPFGAPPSAGASSGLPSPAGSAASGASGGLARQPTFSQPYFAEFEEPSPAAAASLSPGAPLSPSAAACTPPAAAAAVPSPEGSASARAAQLVAAEDQMTAEELHEVMGHGI